MYDGRCALRGLAIAVAVAGCSAEETKPPRAPAAEASTDPSSTPPMIDSGTTDTGTPPPPAYDCGDMPLPPFERYRYDVLTEEDFDFAADGYLVHQYGSDLVGVDMNGTFKVIAPNASADPAGLQVLSTGDIALSDPAEGSLKLFDGVTGAKQLLANDVPRINGIEIDSNDRVYYSEMVASGSVRWIDPYTGERGIVIAHIPYPNGLAFSPDEGTLYVAAGLSSVDAAVVAVERNGDGWSSPRIILEPQNNDTFDGIEVDACGVVYTVGYSYGHVLRTWPDLGLTELVTQLGGGSFFSAMHFGNGVGGWESDHLYITNRNDIYAIDVDVPGRPHPTSP